MGLIGNLLSAGIKVAATPLGVLYDAKKVAEGDIEESGATLGLLGSAAEDVVDGILDPFGMCDDDI